MAELPEPPRDKPKADKQFDPDREYFRDYFIGCGVILIVFLIGWVVIALIWLNR